MIAQTSPLPRTHNATVQVNVSGGSKTSAAGKSQIADEDIKAALIASIRNSLLSDRVAEPGGYRIDLFIADLAQPNLVSV